MSVHRNNPEEEQCYGSCFACIPTCPRHPENRKADSEAENSVSPALTHSPQEEEGQEDAVERDDEY